MSRPRPFRLLLLAGCLGLFAGCASPNSPNAIMDRIDTHRNEYEEWPFPIKDAVMSGQVLKGMDATMVYVARGEPAERVDRGNGDEIWVYRVPGSSSGGGGIMPSGSSISIGTSSPSSMGSAYPGSGYPGSAYPGSGYPGSYPSSGIGISVPLGGGIGGGGSSESEADEEQIVFRNGRVTMGDGVK
jgi:hypothetical protein